MNSRRVGASLADPLQEWAFDHDWDQEMFGLEGREVEVVVGVLMEVVVWLWFSRDDDFVGGDVWVRAVNLVGIWSTT